MKHPFRSHILPFFPAAAGVVGLLLRLWLFSAIDEKGLLPEKHFADSALCILAAITLGILFLSSRKPEYRAVPKQLPGLAAVSGCLLGAIGLLVTGLDQFGVHGMRFSGIAALACLTGGMILLAMAVLKLFHKKIPFLFPAALTIVLMLDTVAQCQVWGSASQLQEYFFPLMASVFLILSAYHITLRAAGTGKPEQLIFFSQSTLFFCCTCLNTDRWFFYLGLLFWVAAPIYSCVTKEKEA